MGHGVNYRVLAFGTPVSKGDSVELLQEYAFNNPDSRGVVMTMLQEYAYEAKDSKEGKAAKHALESIAALTMLEMLHSEMD